MATKAQYYARKRTQRAREYVLWQMHGVSPKRGITKLSGKYRNRDARRLPRSMR